MHGQDFRKMLRMHIKESMLSAKGMDYKRFVLMYERLPSWSLDRIMQTSELVGTTPSMGLFRDSSFLLESRIRASSTEGLSCLAQKAYTSRLMTELETIWSKQRWGKLRLAESQISEEQKVEWRAYAKKLDLALSTSKLSPAEEDTVLLAFGKGVLDFDLNASHAARSWSVMKKISWGREEARVQEKQRVHREEMQKQMASIETMQREASEGGSASCIELCKDVKSDLLVNICGVVIFSLCSEAVLV